MKALTNQRETAAERASYQSQRFERLRKLSELLDAAFHIPGTKFSVGLDSIAGLIPGIGDAATALVSAYMIYEAQQLGASRRTLVRMLANVGIDALVGAVPVAGDVFDAVWKANKKNIRLLEADLARRAAASPGRGDL